MTNGAMWENWHYFGTFGIIAFVFSLDFDS